MKEEEKKTTITREWKILRSAKRGTTEERFTIALKICFEQHRTINDNEQTSEIGAGNGPSALLV